MCTETPRGKGDQSFSFSEKKKNVFHVASQVKKFLFACVKPTEKVSLCASDWKIFFSGGKHVSFHVSNVISEKVFSFLCQDEWKSIFFSCEKFFFMCRANWKKILFSCVEPGEKKQKNFFLVSNRVKKTFFFFNYQTEWCIFFSCVEMSENVFCFFFMFRGKWEKCLFHRWKFFFMCRAKWKRFLHWWNFFFSCVKPSEIFFFPWVYIFFFMCWDK